MVSNCSGVAAAVATVGSADVTADTTWSGTVFLTRPVNVQNGARLTIAPGTNLVMGADTYLAVGDKISGGALNAAGTTILLTTHYLEEAEELCDHIAIIDKGRVVVAERTEDLLRRLDDKSLTITIAERLTVLPETLQGFHLEIVPQAAGPARLVFRYRPSRTGLADLLAALQASCLTVVDLTTEEADLQDIFLQLTGTQAAARAKP